MKFVMKLMLLWMLAIAVPFQGFASAAMLACEQSPPQPATSISHAASGGHEHCAEPQKSQADEASSPSHACTATCGASAVFTLPALALSPPQATRAPVPATVQFIPDAESSTLDRPPRLS